jgi:hypothetical protein
MVLGHFIHHSQPAGLQVRQHAGGQIQLIKKMVRHDWTSPAQISLESGMRKARKVVPITRGECKNARSHMDVPVKEEIRLLTCRQTSASLTFHLGPPLLLRHAASNPRHAQPGKLLPFPVPATDPAKE